MSFFDNRRWKNIEYFLPIIVIVISLIGLLAILIATTTPFSKQELSFDQIIANLNFEMVLRQAKWLVIALAVSVFPVFLAKNQLDTFAVELCREAEMSGRVGTETTRREQVLRERTGLNPKVEWSKKGNIQLNQEITVKLTLQRDLGLFGNFGSFPITLRASATGKSEVYHK